MKNKKRKNKYNNLNNNQSNKGNNNQKSNYVDNKNFQNNSNKSFVKEENKPLNFDNKPVFENSTSKFEEVEEIEQLELDDEEESVSYNLEDDYYRNNNSYDNSKNEEISTFFENDNTDSQVSENIENNDILITSLEDEKPEMLENDLLEKVDIIDRNEQDEFYNSFSTLNDSIDNPSDDNHYSIESDSNSNQLENDVNSDLEKENENSVFEKDEDVFIEREDSLIDDNTQNHFDKWFNENINNNENDDNSQSNASSIEYNNEELEKRIESFENYSDTNKEIVDNELDKRIEQFENGNDFEMNKFDSSKDKLQEVFENNESYNNKILNGNLSNGIINRNEANEIIEEYNIDIPKNSHEDEKGFISNNSVPNTKIYLSFQARISILVCCILLLIVSAFTLIIKSAFSQEVKKVDYEESTSVKYSACLTSSDPYKTKCIDPKEKYNASSIKTMKTTFTYEAKFDEKVNHSLSYYVVVVNRIYDKTSKKNVVYENEDVILDKEVEEINSDKVSFDIEADIDFKEYNDFATNYVKKYTSSSDSDLEVMLYITDGEETRKVATLDIPLMKNDFKVTSTLVSNDKNTAEVILKEWTDKDTRSVIIGVLFVLVAVVLMIRLAKLIMSTVSKKSAYEVKLQEILNEYDRMIVIARDGYESEKVMKVIKVDSFEKLLDMREIFNKPIIYSKVNNVKSEFIVEDEDTIYKYVMKEADIS